jgi:predicted nuclease with TOPRIM domain
LDFKKLKKVQEFKDWYAYACKLEDSVKFLRDRVKSLEADNDSLNEKYRKEVAVREQIFSQNDQLNKALRRANIKVAEVKEKYRSKVAKKCYYCNNELDINMLMMQQTMVGLGGFNSTLDNI